MFSATNRRGINLLILGLSFGNLQRKLSCDRNGVTIERPYRWEPVLRFRALRWRQAGLHSGRHKLPRHPLRVAVSPPGAHEVSATFDVAATYQAMEIGFLTKKWCCAWEDSTDWGAAGTCTRTRGIHADQARLVSVIHVLSAGTIRDRCDCGSRPPNSKRRNW
jgi:hypothetical protein